MVGSPRPKVLIVEDDDATRTFLRRVFLVEGYEVHTVEDGLDALNVLEQHEVDAVVLDLGLPRLSGIDVMRELTQRLGSGRTPVVIVTGRAVEDTALVDGATVLQKPVDPHALIEAVQSAIRSRKAQT